MQCNFRITQRVEFDGSFGKLDIHNAYDLAKWEVSESAHAITMAFRANEYRLKGRPEAFEVRFTGVNVLEIDGLTGAPSSIVVEEMGFMSPLYRDYQWTLSDGEPGPDKHLVLKGAIEPSDGAGGGPVLIRVAAISAEVIVVDPQPTLDCSHTSPT